MDFTNLYSRRQRRLRGEFEHDWYSYEELPKTLKNQIRYILRDIFGDSLYLIAAGGFDAIYNTLTRNYGVRFLVNEHEAEHEKFHSFDVLLAYLDKSSDVEQCLDVVELSFRWAEELNHGDKKHVVKAVKKLIIELNQRFLEAGVGYQYANGQMIRIDSEVTHKEIVLPALNLLHEPYLKGANEEFMSAHSHYRGGKYKECVADCLKAFESTMKAICDKRKWAYDPKKDTAKQLVEICLQKGLIPSFLEDHLTGFRTSLFGLATLRNRQAGHGQGSTPIEVPEHVASYAIHLAATNILLFAKSEAELP